MSAEICSFQLQVSITITGLQLYCDLKLIIYACKSIAGYHFFIVKNLKNHEIAKTVKSGKKLYNMDYHSHHNE